MKLFVRSIMFCTSGHRPASDAVRHILEQRQIDVPSCGAIQFRDLLNHALRDALIGRTLNQQSRGRLDFLAALQDLDDVAFLHDIDGQEIALMVGHQVLVAIGLRHTIAAEGIQDARQREIA